MLVTFSSACAPRTGEGSADREGHRAERVRPGITVLLRDSSALIAGKRIGLLTNQSGIDENGTSDIDLLFRSKIAGTRLIALFSPEHGIRGVEDRVNIASGRDERTGLPLFSLYGATTLPPPDSALRELDVLVIDLQDLGARPWTYPASMVYALRSAGERHLPVLVLDRPNPISGTRPEGPVLDTALAYAGSHGGPRPAKPVALYPIPLRHGLTMGELAQLYNEVLELHADLHVIPSAGWRRDHWFDETGLPWVKPSPNMPDLTSALIYPGLVAFEGTNLSVGRGTGEAFQRVGAPWLDAEKVAGVLNDRSLPGVRFEAERFTPDHPGDGKYGQIALPGVRIRITDRTRYQSTRVGAALLWAVARAHPDSLRVNARVFDDRFGSPSARDALMRGEDPDAVMDRTLPATIAFQERSRRYWLYR